MSTAWIRPYDESGVEPGPRFTGLPPSVPALFAGLAGEEPDAEAVAGPDGSRVTYRELFERAARVAGGLAAQGVRPGDRVAIRLGNEVGWCLAFLGASLAGAVAVPVNTRFTDAEAAYVVADCAAAFTVQPGRALPDGPPLEREAGPDDLAALFYTSGTTGAPKGAMLTHRAILSAAEASRRALGLPHGDVRNLVPAPLFHVMGSIVQWLPTSLAAGTTVLQRSFDAREWLRAIEAERITVLTAVPAMYRLAMHRPEFAATDVSGVRRVGYGGAPTPPDQVRRLREAFPDAELCPGYGLTETCGIVSGLPHDYTVTHADTVGFAMPATEFRLSDTGELLVRGPQLMSGYWGRPEATARALAGGWLHTGDIARITADGAIQLLDRRDDVVNRGGENVYCTEVENALAAHPAVGEVAVVGVPDPVLGKKVAAAVRAPRRGDGGRSRGVRPGADRGFQGAAVHRPALGAPAAQRRRQGRQTPPAGRDGLGRTVVVSPGPSGHFRLPSR
ncbi:class I adenylate-forming enzyme family protein [Amycolatopsis thermoflava]|uniref:class I adenylate-forming enzyme family protein n=1 Tax=Amycolatopsis thermoflava TaxID=84480 RepID=UPI0038270705